MRFYWNRKKSKLKKKFRSITGKDLRYNIGREDEMLKNISLKLGKSEEEVLNIIINL